MATTVQNLFSIAVQNSATTENKLTKQLRAKAERIAKRITGSTGANGPTGFAWVTIIMLVLNVLYKLYQCWKPDSSKQISDYVSDKMAKNNRLLKTVTRVVKTTHTDHISYETAQQFAKEILNDLAVDDVEQQAIITGLRSAVQ